MSVQFDIDADFAKAAKARDDWFSKSKKQLDELQKKAAGVKISMGAGGPGGGRAGGQPSQEKALSQRLVSSENLFGRALGVLGRRGSSLGLAASSLRGGFAAGGAAGVGAGLFAAGAFALPELGQSFAQVPTQEFFNQLRVSLFSGNLRQDLAKREGTLNAQNLVSDMFAVPGDKPDKGAILGVFKALRGIEEQISANRQYAQDAIIRERGADSWASWLGKNYGDIASSYYNAFTSHGAARLLGNPLSMGYLHYKAIMNMAQKGEN